MRQKIRKTMVLISLLAFPVTLYYLSPYLIIQAGIQGIVSGSFLFFATLFISSLLLGRAYCGWVCPAGGVQACAATVTNKKFKGKRRNYIKYIIWIPWIITIILVFVKAGGVKKIEPLYFTDHGISAVGVPGYMMYFTVVGIILILSFVAGRFSFCHSFCWMAPFMIIGSKIKSTLKYPSLHIEAEKSKCISCNQCTKICPMSLEVTKMVQKNDMNHCECVLCGQCIDVCSKGAIKYRFLHKK